MEHIRQFDWCYSKPESHFLQERDIDNSVTERILRNKFHDPLISSDSEDETPTIDWDEVFAKKKNQNKQFHVYVPCLSMIQYPKLSALTGHQHYQLLRVICAQYPDVLDQVVIPRPTKLDHRVFEELRPVYEKEQKEYIEWAKTMWTSNHCIRALQPKPQIETVYEARFKMKAKEMESYPKVFDFAAQIPLETRNSTFDMILDKEIVNADIKMLPHIECRPITKKLTVMRPCPVPEPCNKHPCRFILPTEKTVSILPFTEVQRELAQFALDNNCQYVSSENALKCLVELDKTWNIPVSVSATLGPDGETTNVVVLGSEFSTNKESVLTRTYKAFRHLLQYTLIPPTEKYKMHYKDKDCQETGQELNKTNIFTDNLDLSSDEEDNSLCIDENSQSTEDNFEPFNNTIETENLTHTSEKSDKQNKKTASDVEFYTCNCKDTVFERPPPRSFKKWQVRNRETGEMFDVVVHCSHKVRDKSGEVILEPISEYQLDLGASEQSKEKIRSLALSLYLRKNASLINVRIDGATGEVATFEKSNFDEIKRKNDSVMNDVTNILHSAFAQLQGLLPGHYILRHEPTHGSNALLYASKCSARDLRLNFDISIGEDEADTLKTPPTLTTVLLPFHKMRRIAPCAFTPHQQFVSRRPALRTARAPPRALQWPKKKKKKKKAINHKYVFYLIT
ncbi:uncharacterized protein LOC123670458 [Melitaea cinxia]|uniref:uncharacterized protein LOC123670458 n=1 Tax=Melitaea cinxia TaxID=113334 RepID=UPI001E26F363|nr:uncharacterized protein LOC123670458 [Melitaea cinxia]